MSWPSPMVRRLWGGMSLRAKITAGFVAIVVGGTTIAALIGIRLITEAMLKEARARAQYGLATAHLVYEKRLKDVESLLGQFTRCDRALPHDADTLASELRAAAGKARGHEPLDFVVVVGQDQQMRGAGGGVSPMPEGTIAEIARRVLRGETISSLETITDAAYAAIAPQGPPGRSKEPSSSLALVAAMPLTCRGPMRGAVIGGVILNQNSRIPEEARRMIWGNEQYRGKDIGTVSLFLENRRVATDFASSAGDPTAQFIAPDAVYRGISRDGQVRHDRALIDSQWFLGAYGPLYNLQRQMVGMLYVGVSEAPFLAARTDVILNFLYFTVLGVFVVIGINYIITRSTIGPLEEMVRATRRIASGDLEYQVPVESSDEIGHLATSFNSMLSSLKQMTEQLREKIRQTEELAAFQARMAQVERLASLGRLAAGVAHEINTPLGGILSIAVLNLEDCDPGSPLRKDLDLIVQQTKRVRDIVKALLDFSRPSTVRPTPTSINAVIENTLALLERQAMFHNIQVDRQLQSALPAILIDPSEMQAVVMNLVMNAVDAMEQQGVLGIATTVDEAAQEVLLNIADTGKGIPEKDRPLIFEPFFTTKEAGKGTGLGLAIVHGIVRSVGGRVSFRTSASGTTFTIRLPIAPDIRTDPVSGAEDLSD